MKLSLLIPTLFFILNYHQICYSQNDKFNPYYTQVFSDIKAHQKAIDSLSQILFRATEDTSIYYLERRYAVYRIGQIHSDQTIRYLLENEERVIPYPPNYEYPGNFGAEQILETKVFFFATDQENKWKVLNILLDLMRRQSYTDKKLKDYITILAHSFDRNPKNFLPILEAELAGIHPLDQRQKTYRENLIKMISFIK